MGSTRRARRWSTLAAVAVALAGSPAGAAPAPLAPDIPLGCGIASTDAEASLLAGVDRAALPAFATAVRRAGGTITGSIPGLDAVEVGFASPAAAQAGAGALRRVPGVGWSHRQHRVSAYRSPNDPYHRDQWGLKAIGAYAAWDRETGSRNPVTVAVLDTGIDLAHPDLASRVTDGPNALGGASSHDDHGHGTHVAGIIGAATNNRRGVAGVSWGARMLAVKVLNASGQGTDCTVVNGYLDAVEAGAKVVNMSLGSATECPTLYQLAFDYGAREGVVSVAAAGNSGNDGNPVETPASCNNVIAVGALDQYGKAAVFTGHHDYVAVSAPGVDILSTVISPRTQKHGYGRTQGTSMAAPFVSGLAALLLSKTPTLSPADVRQKLMSTARDLGPPGRDEFYGAGRIDAARALR